MDSAHFTARLAVEALDQGDLDGFNDHLCDLERFCSSADVRQHIISAGAPLACLREASRAAAEGDKGRMTRFRQKAVRYVGEDEVTALIEEHRLSFAVQPQNDPASWQLAHCGFFR
jgi:hypothetical protein